MAAVLAKVQKEIGPNATISSAQKVRSGGMGGFFAREKFEVIVEVPEAGDAAVAQSTQGKDAAVAQSTQGKDAAVAQSTQGKDAAVAQSTQGKDAAVAQSTDVPGSTPTVPVASSDEDYDPVASLLSLAEKISKEDVSEIKVEQPEPAPAPLKAEPLNAEQPKAEPVIESLVLPEALTPDEPQASARKRFFCRGAQPRCLPGPCDRRTRPGPPRRWGRTPASPY